MDKQKIYKKIANTYPLHTCICGKQFIPTGEWVYKIVNGSRKKYYCSYTCWRKAGGGKGKKPHYVKSW